MSFRLGGQDDSLVCGLDSNNMLVDEPVSIEGVLAGDVVRLSGQSCSQTFDNKARVLANNGPL